MKRNKKITLFTTILVLIVVMSGVLIWRLSTTNETPENTEVTDSFNPPTKEEEQAGDQQKDKAISQDESQNASNQRQNKTANVIITDAGQYGSEIEVRSFVPDHYQDGTCTITITKDNSKVEKTTTAYRDASTTICTNPLFSRSEFSSPGTWQVTVQYTAKDASGQSQPKTINIR